MRLIKWTFVFFDHLRGVCFYFQRKVYGKYASGDWGDRVLNITCGLIAAFIISVLVMVFKVALVYALPVIFPIFVVLIFYHSQDRQNEDEEVLAKFMSLSGYVKFFYFAFISLFTIIPISLILLILIDQLIK